MSAVRPARHFSIRYYAGVVYGKLQPSAVVASSILVTGFELVQVPFFYLGRVAQVEVRATPDARSVVRVHSCPLIENYPRG